MFFYFFFLFVNHVKTTERIKMGLQPYDAKSSLEGHRLLFKIPHFIIEYLSSIYFPTHKTKACINKYMNWYESQNY